MIKVGIVGYGNIGRGVEVNIQENPDMELVAIFTRRDPATLKTKGTCPVLPVEEAKDWVGKIDLMFVAGGSATDLPEQTPKYAKMFNENIPAIKQHMVDVDRRLDNMERRAS